MLSRGVGGMTCRSSSTRSDEVVPGCARTATFVPAHVSELLLSSLFILFRLKSVKILAGGGWHLVAIACVGAVGT